MSRSGNGGFTLAEVLAALVLTGVVAALAHQVFGGVTDHGVRLGKSRLALDRSSNAHRFLQAAFLSLEVGTDGAGPFAGRSDGVRFPTWMPTADGWNERRTVTLGLEEDRWLAMVPPDAAVVLASGVGAVRLDYLITPGAESAWVPEWESDVSAPLAVRVRLSRGECVDTMVYLVKARG